MKTLSDDFMGLGPQKGWSFVLVKREGMVAVYRKTKGWSVSWETIVITEHKESSAFGKTFPAREGYPRPEEWGSKGWSYRTEGDALSKMAELVKHYGTSSGFDEKNKPAELQKPEAP